MKRPKMISVKHAVTMDGVELHEVSLTTADPFRGHQHLIFWATYAELRCVATRLLEIAGVEVLDDE